MTIKLENNGLSIVICSHNGRRRIGRVLSCLFQQELSEGDAAEVILVDNGSTDGTNVEALKSSQYFKIIDFRIVREERLGLLYARSRGVAESKFDLICFIDDDNYVENRWIAKVLQIMRQHNEVGACGGKNIPIYDQPPSAWFQNYERCIAVGKQASKTGYVPGLLGRLWGAGLTIRKQAWEDIIAKGHRFYATDRQGKRLLSGQDTELCYAFRLCGWRLWYDDDLSLYHDIPSVRTSWRYLRKLYLGFGMSQVFMAPYLLAMNRQETDYSDSWSKEIFQALLELLKINLYTWGYYLLDRENKHNVLKINKIFGKIFMLCRLRTKYDAMCQNVCRFAERCRE